MKTNKWSDQETKLLVDNVELGYAVVSNLVGRSSAACRSKGQKLGHGKIPCSSCQTGSFKPSSKKRTAFCKSPICLAVFHASHKKEMKTSPRELHRLWVESDGKCSICGQYILLDFKGQHPLGPSVDRIIPHSSGGDYSPDNIRWTHARCNRAKNSFTDKEFIVWCKNVTLYFTDQTTKKGV